MPSSFLPEDRFRRYLIFIGAGLLGVLIFFAVILSFPDQRPRTDIEEISENIESKGLKVLDFYLDEELDFLLKRRSYPMRDKSAGWTKEDVEQYFIPVDKILHDYFQKKNDNYIKEIFGNID